MNLRHYFYHTYFDDLDLRQPTAKKDREQIEVYNQERFKAHNTKLTRPWRQLPQAAALPANVTDAALAVLNPGLLTGSGYTHQIGYPAEFMLGFSFDFTTGMPVLPGHSVKGVLRSVFPQLEFDADSAWTWKKDPAPLQYQKARFVLKTLRAYAPELPAFEDENDGLHFVHRLELALFEGYDAEKLSAQVPVSALLPLSKRAVFFDALAVKTNADDRLMGRDALTPHPDPLKNPVPLPFIKVEAGVEFCFQWRLPEVKIGDIYLTVKVLGDFCTQILKTVGVGAKTNTGYGQLGDPAPRNAPPAAGEQGNRGGGAPGPEGKNYVPPKPDFPEPAANLFTERSKIHNNSIIHAQVLKPNPDKPDKTRLRLLVNPKEDNKSLHYDHPPQPGDIVQVRCKIDINGKISSVEPV